jgi:cell division protease FtsH
MSNLGPTVFGERETDLFLGKEFSESRNYSESVAIEIDKEVEKLIKNAQKEAEKIIKEKKALIEKTAKTLMEKETIEREEFEKIIKVKKSKK